jgi:hypothetical protein
VRGESGGRDGYLRPPRGPSSSSSLTSTLTSTSSSFLITSDLIQPVDVRVRREREMGAGLTNSVFFDRRIVLRRCAGMVEMEWRREWSVIGEFFRRTDEGIRRSRPIVGK